MALGRLGANAGYVQASGEATPQAKLPEKFKSTPPASSPLASHLAVPTEWSDDLRRAPIVQRRPRMVGIRHMYGRGMMRMPIQPLGAGGGNAEGIAVWRSRFQPDFEGTIHNGGFNDALYQAGYPGFNLGLSFKVETLPQHGGAVKGRGVPNRISERLHSYMRASGRPPESRPESHKRNKRR